MIHWAFDYVGLPWVYGARGPNEFDCWGFVKYIQTTKFRIEMPDIDVPSNWAAAYDQIQHHEERTKWDEVIDPVEGDVVLMARNRLPIHIGIAVLANGSIGVLHCLQNTGVVFQTKQNLQMSGWGNLRFFRRHYD
jgi:cell wall-associated NlpC family hydrolase